MALPETGPISLGLVRTELKRSDRISLGDTDVRSLASKPSGMISLSDLRGKAVEVSHKNPVNLTEANIHTLMGSPTEVGDYIFENTATISAAYHGSWALRTGVFPAGSTLTILNRGHIRGGGGNGGGGYFGEGMDGGTGLILNFPAVIDNRGTIWGGGGGGGGGYDGYGGGGGAGIPGGAGGGGINGNNGRPGSATSGGAGAGLNLTYGGDPGGSGRTGGGKYPGSGGRGGYSVQTNGNAVTWIAVGDRRGPVV